VKHRFTRLLGQLGILAATVLAGGILAGSLLRVSPGFGADERELDTRLNEASRKSIRADRMANHDLLGFYVRYFGSVLHGDLGVSESLQRPIAELIRYRAPVTAGLMATGIAGGWALAFAFAIPAVLCRRRFYTGSIGLLTGILICVPSAVLAILVFNLGGPVRAIVALVIFPRVFDYLRNLLQDAFSQPHILTARAKGLGAGRILFRHVLPAAAPQLLALAGVSATMAFGAAIPVETLCDLPGIGQLAWKAALARDLPVLVVLTAIITLATQLCNSVSDWVGGNGEAGRI
jgi:peptide/nickel transport system permease protein